jgi:hypothetical protein
MKKILSAFLLLLSLQSFGQLTAKNVTTIKLKIGDQNTTFQKVKEAEWKMVQKGADGGNTEISGFNVLNADNNSITLEQKLYGVNLKIDLTTKKITAFENGKPSVQNFVFVSANNDLVELENDDVVDIDKSINGNNVSILKWKNEMMNQVFELHKADNDEWEYHEEPIKMKESLSNEEKLFKQIASDNNSITLVEINPDPKNTMFYATKLKIDITSKIVFKAVYEADTKKWTPLEKDENGTNVFLIIK